jgi:Cu-processing system permease protein
LCSRVRGKADMQRLMTVAVNTFRETLRDKILYNLVLFALLLIGTAVLLGTLSIGEQARIVNDLGLAAINLVAVIIAIFVGVGLVSKEIERRTIYTLLARPITRGQFVLGKYLGLVFIVMVNVGIMFAMFLATVLLSGYPVHASLFQAVELILVEALLVMSLALLFSTFSSSILSATMTIAFYVIGHLTTDLKAMAEKSPSAAIKSLVTALFYLCPNLEALNIKGQSAAGISVSLGFQAMATAYGLLYTCLLLAGACLVFQRRDF